MVVAEDEFAAELVAASLAACEARDVSVTHEREGWAALKALADSPPDVVLVDARSADEDAIRFVQLAVEDGSTMPMVLLVEGANSAYLLRASEAGAADFVTVSEVESIAFGHLVRLVARNSRNVSTALSGDESYKKRVDELQRELERAKSDLRLIEDDLRNERLNAIEQLIVTVRHEVNNPLAALLGRAQLLRKRSRNMPEDIANILDEIVNQGRRISAIMDKLDLARDGRTTGYLDGARRIKLD